ncbi:MAG TPA: hypothetical protein PKA16_01930 [Ottowia sp.]|uniref:hypothetical protein n=1 Tax=Ottowia sp. TaxID=1898956 RepID=UPI002BCE0B80|nr:hypothetical protein [Ottowia sp.]HMN20130.1 hypothetical protein [Ottowia sp.]
MPAPESNLVEHAGYLSSEQIRTLVQLAVDKGQYDLMLSIENQGRAIEGESPRQFSDSRTRMEVEGYLWGVATPINSMGDVDHWNAYPRMLYVLRRCDAATASLLSLINGRSDALRITLSAYRAGGEAQPDPSLQFVVEQGRLTSHTLLTAPGALGPCEILSFAGRDFTVSSRPQQGSGRAGAERVFTMNLAGD